MTNDAEFTAGSGLGVSGADTGVTSVFGTILSGSLLPLGAATHWRLVTTGSPNVTFEVDDATLGQGVVADLLVVDTQLVGTDATFSHGAGKSTWVWSNGAAANQLADGLDVPVSLTPGPDMSITLTIPDLTATEAILDWVDTAGNTSFEVRRNGTLIATVNVLTYIDPDLQPVTVYAYTVTGVQTATVSNTVTVTTPDLTDEFNCECETVSTFSTLAQLRTRLAIQVGYAAQAANLPAGMVAECNEYLFTAQRQLYMKYKSLRTERMFRWTMVPGQRYYSLTAAEGSCVKQIDPKRITWVGFEDLNQAWYQLIAGINPLWYTRANITTGWPTRFEIRSCIELFPAPQAAYTLWIKAHFQLEPFAADSDRTSIDDELVLLFAIANMKSAKGKPDWQRAMNQATARLHDLTAGNHTLRRYVPGTTTDSPATPPKFLPLNGAPP